MNELFVTISSSDLSSDKKEQRLQDVLECLLRHKKAQGNGNKQATTEKTQTTDGVGKGKLRYDAIARFLT